MNPHGMLLRATDLTQSELLGVLEELEFLREIPGRCWLEAPDGWVLDRWPGLGGDVLFNAATTEPCNKPLKELLPRVTSGRVFAPNGELKWRLLPALGDRPYRTVFLGGDWPSNRLRAIPLRDELQSLSRAEAIYPLWGQQTARTPGEWIDLRIPHRLRYPVDAPPPNGKRVIAKVRVEIWSDASGQPQFIRLCDLSAEVEN